MTQYELMFDVATLENDAAAMIYASYDALVSDHEDATSLTITAEGSDGAGAAYNVARALKRFGVEVERLVPDLVLRSEIADRCGVDVQLVEQWLAGSPGEHWPFPSLFSRSAGGLWLWGEVNSWLKKVGYPSDPIRYPCRGDYDEVNTWLGVNINVVRIRTEVRTGIVVQRETGKAGGDRPMSLFPTERVLPRGLAVHGLER